MNNCKYCHNKLFPGDKHCSHCGGPISEDSVQEERIVKQGRILSSSPRLTDNKRVECHLCRSVWLASQKDVISFRWRKRIKIRDLPASGIWEKWGFCWSEEEADGYEYEVRCPVCQNITIAHDHLCNFIRSSYEYGPF